MSTAAAMAFWFHSLLCLAFLATAGCALAGWESITLTDQGPGPESRSDPAITAIFYFSGGLYLLYAELYLYQIQGWG